MNSKQKHGGFASLRPTDVEIVKHANKVRFECSNCGCVFKVSQQFCDYVQVRFNEYAYEYACPECHKTCSAN